jgi:hypothetical protein
LRKEKKFKTKKNVRAFFTPAMSDEYESEGELSASEEFPEGRPTVEEDADAASMPEVEGDFDLNDVRPIDVTMFMMCLPHPP